MSALIVAVILGLAVLAGGLAQKYLHTPAPWIWVAVGACLSFVPLLEHVALPPDVVLYLCLPALLYWESLNTSAQQLRYDARSVTLLSVGLVAATAAAVAGLGVLAGLALPVALVLGAILAPTDATALSALSFRFPRRIAGILQGESLLNDGSALALYSVAVAAVLSGTGIQPLELSLRFVYAVLVGCGTGLIVGYLIYRARRIAGIPTLDDTIAVLSPFAMFLPAELLGASGVVAVVTGGLYLSRVAPRVVSARSRTESYAFWRATTYVINGVLFVLIGWQARTAIATFVSRGWAAALLLAAACAVAVFVVRLAWVLVQAPIIRLVDRRASQRGRREAWRNRMILAWGGFRGAVSLAAALSLPLETSNGHPFPGRELVIAVTFFVIVFALFVQGATLPFIVRAARVTPDGREADERRLAVVEPVEDALAHLDEDARKAGATDIAKEFVRESLSHELDRATDESSREHAEGKRQLQLRTIARRRKSIIQLRDQKRIDDSVLLRAQESLDYEELHLREQDDEN